MPLLLFLDLSPDELHKFLSHEHELFHQYLRPDPVIGGLGAGVGN